MAVSRKLNDDEGFINVNDEVTIFGASSLQQLFALLIGRGIFPELSDSRFSSNLACLLNARDISFAMKPKLIRFVGHFFSAIDADDLIEFFYHLKNRGLVFEIVDPTFHRYVSKASYFLDCVIPQVRLLSYSVDLKAKEICLFSNEQVNRRILIQWARQLNVVYSIENVTDFIRMIDGLNHGYLMANQQDFSIASSNPMEQSSGFLIKNIFANSVQNNVYYQAISAEAQVDYCLNFIRQAYSQVGGVRKLYQALLSSLSQDISDDLNSKISLILMSLEGLLVKSSFFGLFQSNLPAEIIALNNDVEKNTCARMLGLLLKACAGQMEDGPIKASLLELVNPIDHADSKHAAVYRALETQLAALAVAVDIEQENNLSVVAKK
ncbi:MAG: hypothetical protein WAW86_03405 [Gammaproteobacteria bacterium]